MPTVTLLVPGVRTLPTASRIYVFQSGKREGGVPEDVAIRCETTNMREGRQVFKVERNTDQVAIEHGIVKTDNKAGRRSPELMGQIANQLEFPGWL